jgi:preprotein translocase subunit SecA
MIGTFKTVFKKVFGTANDREVRRLSQIVGKINEIEATLKGLSDDDLRRKTAEWKARLSVIEDNDQLAKELEEIMPEAFAVVKNACRRL